MGTMLDNPFLVNLRATYKDEYRVYFLLEACLGGELFTILRKMRSFDEATARFYCVMLVEAFDYMHERDIIYRDLKPENLVLTRDGYLKVTDFGFAKVVPNKTFTLCGTPDYLAPEIVTGQGHGKGVDWWTLGILIYEMLASFPPFFDDEPMMTYRKIIQGKFEFRAICRRTAKTSSPNSSNPKAPNASVSSKAAPTPSARIRGTKSLSGRRCTRRRSNRPSKIRSRAQRTSPTLTTSKKRTRTSPTKEIPISDGMLNFRPQIKSHSSI